MKDDIKEFFSNTEKVKKLCPSYNGEYANIIVKEKYDKYPKINYPMIAISDIKNEDLQRYFDDSGENVAYMANQFEISATQDDKRTAIQNVRRIADILDKYLKGDRYRCLRRIGDPAMTPLKTDKNVMVCYLRYEYNLDIKTNTIYRRY